MGYTSNGTQMGGIAVYLACLIIGLIASIIISSKRNKDIDYWENKSKLGSIVLAVLLGRLGIHRFYLNRKTSGIIQLLGFLSMFMIGALPDSLFWIIMYFSLITGFWSKLDIFLLLFGGLVPYIASSSTINDEFNKVEDDDHEASIDYATPILDNHYVTEAPTESIPIIEESVDIKPEDASTFEAADDNMSAIDPKEINHSLSSEDPDDKTSSKNINLIRELSTLHKEGILTDEEFCKKKAEVLSRL